jgi:hypothetical protein
MRHRRQRHDIELDGFGGVARLRRRLGDDEGDGVADEAHLVEGEREPQRLVHRRAVAVLERDIALERAVAGGREVLAGEHAEHAGQRPRGGRVDAADDAVGVAAAHHHGIGLPGNVEVVGIAAVALHQARVLGAAHRLPDGEFLQRPVGLFVAHGHVHGRDAFR